MFNVELFESILAVVGVVMFRFGLLLTVLFVMAIPIGIACQAAAALGRHARRVPATQAVGSGVAAARVPR